MDRVDCTIIGAGVVGLAVARALAQAGLEVVVLEQEPRIGTGVSARNSEVIHAGLYYSPGSLKAQLCVRGKELLYGYCESHGIAHRRCGKLLVATSPQDVAKLDAIQARALENGVPDLQRLSRVEALALEPELECVAALLSPSSGIIDSHGLMTALLDDATRFGAILAVASPFADATWDGSYWRLGVDGEERFEFASSWLINSAGLNAQSVALRMKGFPAQAIPAQHLAKGHYFSVAGRAPFARLIYPTPGDGGLGVHFTLDLGGQAKFGPDVEWLTAAPLVAQLPKVLDHAVDDRRAGAFVAQIRRYWPGLADGALTPAYAGIRPKIAGPGAAEADFVIRGPAEHGCDRAVQLFGIESPGLTASMAIGEHVAAMIAGTACVSAHP